MPDLPIATDGSWPALTASDERSHAPGTEPLWGESWYLDYFDEGGELGGYVRLGLYPNLGKAWYWACVVGEGRRLTTVIDHDVPLPKPGSLEVRSEGLWADHTVEEPFDHLTLGCESFATVLDHPADTYGDLRGERVAFGFELEWENDGAPAYPYPSGITRYEVPCRVHGQISVGEERIDFDGWGQRDHSWGVRDWWFAGWQWTAGRLEDGERFHGTQVNIGDDPLFATGYVQPAGGRLEGLPGDQVARTQELGEHGFPTSGETRLGGLDLAIEPVAFSPVHLVADDGRTSRFPRALCRFEDRATGRRGAGWTEWNQPQ